VNDELKKAKALGYSNGYAAGRKRLESDLRSESRRVDEKYFWDAVFLAATPAFIEAQGWKQGEKDLVSLIDRAQLAADWAREAVKLRRKFTP
jgi:hypothetical protein